MSETLYQYLAGDHERIASLLKVAIKNGSPGDSQAYEQFRKALLRHISTEEKIVFPELSHNQGGVADSVMQQLRLDHGALVTLLVPTPEPSVIHTLKSILELHNALEEQVDGIYERFDRLAGGNAPHFLELFKAAPQVPVLPTKPLQQVIDAVRRAVSRAGYKFMEF